MKPKFRVVWLRDQHAERVRDLMNDAFPDEKWKKKDLFAFCNKRSENSIKVLLYGHRVLGVMFITLERKKCRIRRLAVFKHLRRRGYARLLVKTLVSESSPLRRPLITAVVREKYLSAQLFFRDCVFDDKQKFVFDADRRHRYADGKEGYVFKYHKPLRSVRTIRREKRA